MDRHLGFLHLKFAVLIDGEGLMAYRAALLHDVGRTHRDTQRAIPSDLCHVASFEDALVGSVVAGQQNKMLALLENKRGQVDFFVLVESLTCADYASPGYEGANEFPIGGGQVCGNSVVCQ